METRIAIVNQTERADLPARAHGLDGSLVAPDWLPLTLAELQSVLNNFPAAGRPTAILTTSPRPFSAAGVIETSRGRVFVKRHARAIRNAEGLAEEHRFMQHLRENCIEVPRVLATSTRGTALESHDGTYEVHEIPAGIDLYEDAISWTPFLSAPHARSAGEIFARMHLAAESFNAPPRTVQPLVASFSIFASQNPAKALQQYLAARHPLANDAQTLRDCEQALDLLAPFHDELKPLLPALLPLWTHNDLHASNLFWSDTSQRGRATSVIDFGLADLTNAVHDLAHAIERNIVEWLVLMNHPEHGDRVPVHLDHLWALLDGYNQVRSLSDFEATALAPMLALCHVEFALTEADYFLGVLHSPEKARIATNDYLVGHAKWFRGPGSHTLLDPLRRWAETRRPRAVRA
jgi:Ser/Thr protein kinase RdoA (MazF antagonist)